MVLILSKVKAKEIVFEKSPLSVISQAKKSEGGSESSHGSGIKILRALYGEDKIHIHVGITRKILCNCPFNAKISSEGQTTVCTQSWNFKLFKSPEIDSKESIPPAYVAWRAGTITLFLLGSKAP